MRIAILHLSVFLLFLSSCDSNETVKSIADEARKDSGLTVRRRTGEPIKTMTLTESTFNHELASNGKVAAKKNADLHFNSNEQITHIWVRNGDRVRKGQKIAQLELFSLERLLCYTHHNLQTMRQQPS